MGTATEGPTKAISLSAEINTQAELVSTIFDRLKNISLKLGSGHEPTPEPKPVGEPTLTNLYTTANNISTVLCLCSAVLDDIESIL